MSETWLPVVGWEGFYEVSDMGNVRSVARVIQRSTAPQYVRERVLRAPAGTHGYPRVNLSRNGAPRQFLVHRLVLEAFVGLPPDGLEALHGNGVRSDCRLSNLRWGTSAENKADTIRHGHNYMANKTECKHGHPYDAENTYPLKDGRRECRACKNARNRACKQRLTKAEGKIG